MDKKRVFSRTRLPVSHVGAGNSGGAVTSYGVVGPFPAGGVMTEVGIVLVPTKRDIVTFAFSLQAVGVAGRGELDAGIPLIERSPYAVGKTSGIRLRHTTEFDHAPLILPVWRPIEVGPVWLGLGVIVLPLVEVDWVLWATVDFVVGQRQRVTVEGDGDGTT